MKRYLKKVIICSEVGDFEVNPKEEWLYVVDREKDLKWLKSMGLPVAAWLHEGNKDQDLSQTAYAVEDPHALNMDVYERVYRREKGIPWDILETNRCLVREMIPEDCEAFEKIYQEPAIQRYMEDFHGDKEGEAAYIREYRHHYRFYEYGVWSIVLKETGEVIGRAGFLQAPTTTEGSAAQAPTISGGVDQMDDLPYLGYMIGTSWQGRGIAYEVCKAILDYGREELGFEQVALLVDKDNEASIGLADKLGFVDMGCSGQVLRKVLKLGRDSGE